MHARMWPGRFINASEEQSKDELRGFYLVGLSSNTLAPRISPSRQSSEEIKELNEQKKQAYNKFTDILRAFEQHLRDEEKKYDVTESYIRVSRVSRQAVGENIRSDTHIWWDQEFEEGSEGTLNSEDDSDGDIGLDDSDEDCDVVMMEDTRNEEDIIGGNTRIGDINELNSQVQIDAATLGNTKNSRSRKRTQPQPQHPVQPTGYLRPASDVMNRIKWDPEIDIRDYIVGYEDRFLGIKETEMSRWKREQTDEEFIPEHRVVYFKRRSDGVKVWDRERRRDLVFGSGVSE